MAKSSKPFRWWPLVALVVAAPGIALAVNLTGTARMEVVQPLSITALAPLDFGLVLPQRRNGRATCTPKSVVVRVSGLTQVGGCQAGTFRITGESHFAFSISLPRRPIELTAPGVPSGGFVTVKRFKSIPRRTGHIGTSGSTLLRVGATLNVKGDAPHGRYVGTYTVTVDYN